MKHCTVCNVNVHERLTNCPLCGAYLTEDGVGMERYSREIEKNVNSYEIEYKSVIKRNFWSKRVLGWCFILIALCVLINVLTSKQSLWSGYVAVGVMVTYFAVISNAFKKARFYVILANCAIYVSLAVVLIDVFVSFDTVQSMAAFGFSLKFVVPALLVAIIICCDVLVGKGDKKCTYYLLTMFWTSLLAMIPQIAVWIFFPEWEEAWLSLAALLFAVLNGLVVATVHSKDIVSEIKRKFNTR